MQKAFSAGEGAPQIVQQVLPMTDVTLWSPDQPYLYTLVTKLEKSATAGGGGSSSGSALIVDEVRTVFGVRCGKRLL
jgi:hypothetical protein